MGFETEYVRLFQERQRLLYEIQCDGGAQDLGPVERSLYEACRDHEPARSSVQRRALLATVAIRGRVDFHPSVSTLRSRLDDPSNYRDGLGRSDDGIGADMEADLVALIDLRNSLAGEQGFASYVELAMWHEGLDLESVRFLARTMRKRALPGARRTVAGERLDLDSWHEGLERIGGLGPDDVTKPARSLATTLTLDDVADRITWLVRKQPIYGVAYGVSVPDDVRILLGRTGSLTALATAFHEFGHALGHASNRADGIGRTWQVTTDEAMAVVMEAIGIRLMMTPGERARLSVVEELETARLATSLLFELDVNERPVDARRCFEQWYGPLAPFSDASMWARDSFRSVDPIHVQGYLVGTIVADATLAFLNERYPHDPGAWGAWLTDNYYAPGRSRSLAERLVALEHHRPETLDPVLTSPR